jgi:ATP-dependent DNA helicase RecG
MSLKKNDPQIENEFFENKTVNSGKLPENLWESITAFSNADGGTILLGVTNSGERKGVKKKYLDKLQCDIISQCKSEYNHTIYPEITIDSDQVIRVYIPPVPASFKPIFTTRRGLPRGGKIRIGSANVTLDDEWIRRFAIAARGGAETIEFTANFKKVFDNQQIDHYLKQVKAKRGDIYLDLSKGEILTKLRARSGKDKVTLFGLLAFSKNNSLQESTAPTVNIAVTQYVGTSKVNEDVIEDVSLDDREFNGSAKNQYEAALKFIASKLPVKSKIDPEGKRREHLVIPIVALRETLANAIVHRDYSTYASRIQVDIYVDRIEFSNPGRSLVPLNILDIAHPESRNPLLINLFRDLNIAEQRGRGIRTIRSSLKRASLAEPTFQHRGDWFVATIYNSAFIKDNDQVWLEKFQRFNLKDRQLNALVYTKNNPQGISNGIYRDINNMESVRDDVRASKDLNKMVKMGILLKVGSYRHTHYILNPKLTT